MLVNRLNLSKFEQCKRFTKFKAMLYYDGESKALSFRYSDEMMTCLNEMLAAHTKLRKRLNSMNRSV